MAKPIPRLLPVVRMILDEAIVEGVLVEKYKVDIEWGASGQTELHDQVIYILLLTRDICYGNQ